MPDKTKSSSPTKQDERDTSDSLRKFSGSQAEDPDDLHDVCDDYLAKGDRESDVIDDTYIYGNRNRLSFLETAKLTLGNLERMQVQMNRMQAELEAGDWTHEAEG